MARHASFISAIILGSMSLSWSASAMAKADTDALPDSVLLAQMAARLAKKDKPSLKALPPRLNWGEGLSVTDRVDLANRKIRTVEQDIGPVDLALTAGRAINAEQRYGMPYALDHWTLKFVGASASLPLLSDVAFVMDGEYARMARRLSILEVTPHRLATAISRVGAGLSFGQEAGLMLNYVSVARSRGQDDLTRMAETLGGAPATGHGPELSFTLGAGMGRGQSNWRFSLASMQRPMRDLGLAAENDIRHDARAMLSFNLHL